MVEKTVFKNEKQNRDKQDTDIPSLISRRESKKELLNHSFTSAILKDVNIYDDGKFSHLYSRYKYYDANKYITVDIETNNNEYESTFIITPHDVVYDSSQFEDLFKKLQNKKGKTIFVGKMFNTQIITLNKPFKNSISYQYITTFIKKSIPDTILVTSILFQNFILTYFVLARLNLSVSEFIPIYLLMQVFIGIFTYMIYLYGLKHTNPSTFKLHKPNDINELNESANISKKFDDSIPHNFTKQTATINAFQNGEVIIHNDVATWTFKSDKDVISEEAIELYKKYGGMVDNNKDITIYVSKYNNEKLDKNQYISDCGNYIFKPDYI